MKRVLVVGMPRSGTTWVGHVLAAAAGTELLDEPDNHFVAPYAYRAKRRLAQGSYPQLDSGDEAPDYAVLWKRAFAVGPEGETFATRARRRISRELLQRSAPAHVTRVLAGTVRPGRALRIAEHLAVPELPPARVEAVVAKSVYAPFAVEWISALCAVRIVIVLRHPLNVLSSWVELGWLRDDPLEPLGPHLQAELATRYGAPPPSAQGSALERAAWLAGALTSALHEVRDVAGRRIHVTHESLVRQEEEGFRRLAHELDLEWDPRAAKLLQNLDRPGRGFDTARLRAGLEDVWRVRLSPEQVQAARSVLSAFPAGQAWPPLEAGH